MKSYLKSVIQDVAMITLLVSLDIYMELHDFLYGKK